LLREYLEVVWIINYEIEEFRHIPGSLEGSLIQNYCPEIWRSIERLTEVDIAIVPRFQTRLQPGADQYSPIPDVMSCAMDSIKEI